MTSLTHRHQPLVAAVVALVLAWTSPTAHAQVKATGGRTTLTKQNGMLNGQRSDLKFELVNVSWKSEPCPGDNDKRILTGLCAEVKITWVMAYNHFGSVTPQGEAKGKENGDDFFTVQWQGKGRYTMKSVTRNGMSVFGGANPEGVTGGNGTWDGVKITPPDGFENARPRSVTYAFEWEYDEPNGNNCKVNCLPIKGWYNHTYIDDYHFWSTPGVSISAGFPWSVGVGVQVDGTSVHAWTKQLINPGGKSHTSKLCPPENFVPQESCCPQPIPQPDPEPEGDLDEDETDDDVDRGQQGKVSVTGNHIETAIVTTRAPDSQLLVEQEQIVTIGGPCDLGCGFEAFINVPIDYTEPAIDIEIALFNQSGAVEILEKTMLVNGPPTNPQVQVFPPNPDDRVGPGSMVQVYVEDESPDADLATVASRLQFYVMSDFVQPEQATDIEDGFSVLINEIGPGQFEMVLVVQQADPLMGGQGTPSNGVAEANDGDRIHIVYEDNDAPTVMRDLPFSALPESVPWHLSEIPPGGGLFALGQSTGQPSVWGVCDLQVPVPLPPGASGFDFAFQSAQQINAACGFQAAGVGFDGRLTLLPDAGPASLLQIDPGLFIVTTPPCEGDIADSSGFGPPDGIVDFGDFFSLSFLAGSCGEGTGNPACLGDLADGTGFGPPDGVIDFGDFFALSFLAGPCP